jgi:hypothetical protein
MFGVQSSNLAEPPLVRRDLPFESEPGVIRANRDFHG